MTHNLDKSLTLLEVEERYWTVPQAADAMGLCYVHVLKLVELGKIVAAKVGIKWYVLKESALNYRGGKYRNPKKKLGINMGLELNVRRIK